MKTTQPITRSPHRLALLLAWGLAGALMMGAPAQAERGQPRGEMTVALAGDAPADWRALTPQQREVLRPLASQWPEMDDTARAKWLKDWDQGFADPQHVGVALSEAVAQGDWRLFFLTRDRVRDIALADVQRVAATYLRGSNRTLGRYLPTVDPQRAPAPERVEVAQALKDFKPAAALAQVDAFDPSPANIDASTRLETLPVGLQLALLPKPTRSQVVQGRLVLRHGTVESLAGQGEADAALAAMLDKGTQQRSRQAWQDRLDALQADVGFGAAAGQLSVAFTARRDTLAEVLGLIAEALRTPALSQAALDEVIVGFLKDGVNAEELARIKTQVRASTIYARDDAGGLARLYGQALAVGLTVQDVQDWPDILQSVTEAEIMAAAAEVFDRKRAVTGWLQAPEPAAATEEATE